MAASGDFRVTDAGRIETRLEWRGRGYVEVPWRLCDPFDSKGYRYVSYKQARVKAHRLAYKLYHPEQDIAGLEINHENGDPLDNREANLELCDASRQSQHAFNTGLNPAIGEAHPLAKLTSEAVREIRRLRKLGVTYVRLAQDYGVTPRAIRLVCLGETWRHVD